MFLKMSNFVFTMILLLSTMMAISSNSWFVSWLALEINLMMLIPLMINKISFNSTNVAIKYFLTQAFASIIIISSFIMFFISNFSNSIEINNELIMLAMMMKSGIPPFQFWLPQVLELSNMLQSFIILTWQKIAPFMFLSYINSKMMLMFITMSAIVGGLGGMNQNSLMKIMAYSSMIHASWMISAVMISEKTWASYFLIYSMIMAAFFIFMMKFKCKKISSFLKSNLSFLQKITFSMNVLSMGGLPPFLGFVAKISIIMKMMIIKMMMTTMVLVSSSLISLLYYTRLCYSVFLSSYFKSKTYENKNINKMNLTVWMSITINLMVLPLVLLT